MNRRSTPVNIFEQMLARYDIKTDVQKKNAIHEVMQEITLAGLYRGGFFDKAAFYGGTCLRIFHELPRFSEDMVNIIMPQIGFITTDCRCGKKNTKSQSTLSFTQKKILLGNEKKISWSNY